MPTNSSPFEAEFSKIFGEFKSKLTSNRKAEDFKHIPCLFAPLAGEKYGGSLLKIAFIGKETLYWGKDKMSLSDQLETDWKSPINADFFYKQGFLEYKTKRMTLGCFWGFVLKVLSEIYGVSDWKTLRKNPQVYSNILKSFLWSNVHAIETESSIAIKNLKKVDIKSGGIDITAHRIATKEADSFNKYRIIKTHFAPDVCILTSKGKSEKSYIKKVFFENFTLEASERMISQGTIDVYKLTENGKNSYILHIWHPTYIFRKGKNRLIGEYAQKIVSLVKDYFPDAFQQQKELFNPIRK